MNNLHLCHQLGPMSSLPTFFHATVDFVQHFDRFVQHLTSAFLEEPIGSFDQRTAVLHDIEYDDNAAVLQTSGVSARHGAGEHAVGSGALRAATIGPAAAGRHARTCVHGKLLDKVPE